MKKEITAAPSFDMRPRRGRALEQMFSEFLNERPVSLSALDEMCECLTPEEQKASFDTIATVRLRAFIAEGKPIQAYNALMSALRENPLNLPLQIERSSVLSCCHEHLDRLLADDPQSPMIEILYDLLLKEAYLSPLVQGRYLGYLVRLGKFREAAALAFPLIGLYPAMIGLRDTVEEIAIKVPSPRLKSYAMRCPVALSRQAITTEITPRRARELTANFGRLQEQIRLGEDHSAIDKALEEAIGAVSEMSTLDLTYKDYYFLKAVHDGNRGRHWDAILLFQNLVELDPCNMYFRRSLDLEVRRFSRAVAEMSEKNEIKIDLVRAYPVLQEIAVVPFNLLKQVCLREVAVGLTAPAKLKMNDLCALNPFDGDYLLAALDVAIEAKDHAWMEGLIVSLEALKAERPWDLTIAAFETA